MNTTFLFAVPTFLSGVARLIDFGGVYDLYNESRDGNRADAHALYSDFRMVGQDLQRAMEIFRTDHHDGDLHSQQLVLAFQQKDTAVKHGAEK